jgi:hypothetical protein
MGTIRELSTGALRILEPEHYVGRTGTYALRIEERYVSAHHALLRWSGERWEVRDLGSRNGTFVNATRIVPGDEQPLHQGDRIAFGALDQQWELVDESPPSVMATPRDGGEPLMLEGELIAIPSSEDPRATIYRINGGWVLERPDESITPITNLQTFDVGGGVWRFCCTNDALCKTSVADSAIVALRVRDLQLAFEVSTDEENVHVRMTCGGRTWDLGIRNHNYLLLTLARRRLEDVSLGISDASGGWIDLDDLGHDASMAAPQLNLDVFRIRKQFALAGVADAAMIIERRPRTRQLRLGTATVSVVRV